MFCRGSRLLSHFLLFVISFASTRADYIIDDANSSVRYSDSVQTTVWYPMNLTIIGYLTGTNNTDAIIDYNRLFDQTVGTLQHLAELSDTDTFYRDARLPPVSFPSVSNKSPTIYNMSLFDMQSLPFGHHSLVITLNGGMLFDYATVNESAPAPHPSPSSTSSSTSSTLTPTANSRSSFPIAAVVGSVMGGLAVIMIFVFVFLYFLRERRKAEVFKEEPNLTRYHPDDVGPQLHQQNMATATISRPSYSSPTLSPFHTSKATIPLRQNIPSPNGVGSLLPEYAEEAADAGVTSRSDEGRQSNLSSINFRASGGGVNIPNQLTEEQAEYVQNLYSLRVPAPAIAAVVERMLREGDVPASGQGSSTPVETSMAGVGAGVKRGFTTVTMPPSY